MNVIAQVSDLWTQSDIYISKKKHDSLINKFLEKLKNKKKTITRKRIGTIRTISLLFSFQKFRILCEYNILRS